MVASRSAGPGEPRGPGGAESAPARPESASCRTGSVTRRPGPDHPARCDDILGAWPLVEFGSAFIALSISRTSVESDLNHKSNPTSTIRPKVSNPNRQHD